MSRPRVRRRDKPPAPRVWLRGGAVLLVAALLGFLATRLYDGVPGRDYGQVYVSAPLVGNLLTHDAVRIGGVRVGQVADIAVDEDGRPRVDLQLNPGVKLPVDTTVGIRANGLLGARFVEVRLGSSKRILPDGATLRARDDDYTFGLPEALDVFDTETRAGLRAMVDGLGAGMAGRGRGLRATLSHLSEQTQHFTDVADATLARPGALARLLPSLQAGLRPLDRNRRTTGPFLDATHDALRPFVAERHAVQDTLEVAPRALGAASTGLGDARALLAGVRDLSRRAEPALAAAPRALRATDRLLTTARPGLTQIPSLTAKLAEAIPGLVKVADAARPVVARLLSTVGETRPLLEVVGRRGCDIITFGTSMRSMTGFAQSGSGPLGPAMAFRLQIVTPLATDAVGVQDTTGLLRRDAYSAPCRYPSTAYPQPGGAR